MPHVDYFKMAKAGAEQYRDRVLHVSSVRVGLTVIGPDCVTRVPCGEATFPRCEADVFEKGILTITSQDTGDVVGEYQPGQWTDATVYDHDGDIRYHFSAQSIRLREQARQQV